MIPIGYNAKFIERPESWLGNGAVEEILSVSECISESPINHTALWLCNHWLLYDTIDALDEALSQTEIDGNRSLRRFFYEAYPETILDEEWEPIKEPPSGVVRPSTGFELRGYDIVCFSSGPAPECSPLSCNSGAKHYQVNRHCLLRTLEEALVVVRRIDTDGGYEPGPYGIMSVWEETANQAGSNTYSIESQDLAKFLEEVPYHTRSQYSQSIDGYLDSEDYFASYHVVPSQSRICGFKA